MINILQIDWVRAAIIALVLAAVLQIERYLGKHNKKMSLKQMFQLRLVMFAEVLVGILAILLQFQIIKDNADQLVLSSSLIVAVVGFCFQESFSNIVHGLVLIFADDIKKGDRISIGDITGYVISMDMRSFHVQDTRTGCIHYIPNKMMDNEIVKNYTNVEEGLNTYFLTVSITYESDVDKAIELIAQIVREEPDFVGDEVVTMVSDLADSSVVISVKVATQTIEQNFSACSNIRRRLVKELPANGIEIAYPHIEVVRGDK